MSEWVSSGLSLENCESVGGALEWTFTRLFIAAAAAATAAGNPECEVEGSAGPGWHPLADGLFHGALRPPRLRGLQAGAAVLHLFARRLRVAVLLPQHKGTCVCMCMCICMHVYVCIYVHMYMCLRLCVREQLKIYHGTGG